ncbi:MAG: hypothetical protein FWG07_04520 [Treponema sp.]|nr:hypothetical protein [Treponema sp.]
MHSSSCQIRLVTEYYGFSLPDTPAHPKKRIYFIINSWKVNAPFQKEMYKDGIPKNYKMLIQSECLILPFFRQKAPSVKPKKLSSLNCFASIWCCIENILLAIINENLGCALRISFEKETENIFEILKHPKDYFMPCYLAIGYPLHKIKNPDQIKLKIKDKIHYNKW